MLAAATPLEGQLAHTYFMPFAGARRDRRRGADTDRDAPVDDRRGGVVQRPGAAAQRGALPPPGSNAMESASTMFESLRCEWFPVRRGVANAAVRPAVHASHPAGPSPGAIDDDDWRWRLLGGYAATDRGRGTEKGAKAPEARGGEGTRLSAETWGEDLGAAVERTNVRGLSARVDRGVRLERRRRRRRRRRCGCSDVLNRRHRPGLGMDVGALTAAMRPPDLAALTDGKPGGQEEAKGLISPLAVRRMLLQRGRKEEKEEQARQGRAHG